jgi:hypothetical protein
LFSTRFGRELSCSDATFIESSAITAHRTCASARRRSPLLVGAPRELSVRARYRVALEDADEQPMRRFGKTAIVRKVARHNVSARDIAMDQEPRCPAWLKPVDILEVA